MRLTWTCFLKDVAVADAATMANSKRTKVFIVIVVAIFCSTCILFAPFLKIQTQALPAGQVEVENEPSAAFGCLEYNLMID